MFSIASSDDEAPLVLPDFSLLIEESQDVDEADESVVVLSEYRVAGPELATADRSIGRFQHEHMNLRSWPSSQHQSTLC